MSANRQNTVGIVLARMDSQRLPGKPLRPIGGIPLLGRVIRRARMITGLSRVVVATTVRSIDDPLTEYASDAGVDIFRGACEDVADRVLKCAEHYDSRFFVRLNADSPFLDQGLIDCGIRLCDDGVQFVTNLIGRTFPYGIAVEVVETAFFRNVCAGMKSYGDREHVTRAIYSRLDQVVFRQFLSSCPELSRARLVVDTEADLQVADRLVSALGCEVATAGYERVARLRMGIHPEGGGEC